MCHRIFIVNGARPIRMKKDVDIKVCEKTVWVAQPNSPRKLLGATAFPTMQQAEYKRWRILSAAARNTFIARYYPDVHTRNLRSLAIIEGCSD